jgi:hypothetical protein
MQEVKVVTIDEEFEEIQKSRVKAHVSKTRTGKLTRVKEYNRAGEKKLTIGGVTLEKYVDIYGQNSMASSDLFKPRIVILPESKMLVIGTTGYDWGPSKLDTQIQKMVIWAVQNLPNEFPGYKIFRTYTGYTPNKIKVTKDLVRVY